MQSWRSGLCASDVCACDSDVCAGNFSHSGRLLLQQTRASFNARLVPSGSPYIESWYVRLKENARVGGNALKDIMSKCGQCQNKGCLFILQISIVYVWHWCIVSIYRSISMNRFTPNIKLTAHLCPRPRAHVLIYRKVHCLSNAYINVKTYVFNCWNYNCFLMGFIAQWRLLDSIWFRKQWRYWKI